MSRCDLHVHSRHSARSEEWLFRRFDFPDSYSDPKQLYEQLRKRGMDYVTITDHDSIDGCLEIAIPASDLHQRAGHHLFSAGRLQAARFGVGDFGTAASRYRKRP